MDIEEHMYIREDFLPGFFKNKFRIHSDRGSVYEGISRRDLSFTVTLDGKEIVSSKCMDGNKRILLLATPGNSKFARIEWGRLFPLTGARIIVGDCTYRMPSFSNPAISKLGLRFPRFCFPGLLTPSVKIKTEENRILAIGLLGYLEACRFVN